VQRHFQPRGLRNVTIVVCAFQEHGGVGVRPCARGFAAATTHADPAPEYECGVLSTSKTSPEATLDGFV
jgi:hypothetical protein